LPIAIFYADTLDGVEYPDAPNPHFSVRRERRRFSVGESPTRQLSLRPVAIGAAVEAMKPLKPLVEGITVGDSAIMQAVT